MAAADVGSVDIVSPIIEIDVRILSNGEDIIRRRPFAGDRFVARGDDLDRDSAAARALGDAFGNAEAVIDVAAARENDHAADTSLLLKPGGAGGHEIVPYRHHLIRSLLLLRCRLIVAVQLRQLLIPVGAVLLVLKIDGTKFLLLRVREAGVAG